MIMKFALPVAMAVMMISTSAMAATKAEEEKAVAATVTAVSRCTGIMSVIAEAVAKRSATTDADKAAAGALINSANKWTSAAGMLTLVVDGDKAKMEETSRTVQGIVDKTMQFLQDKSLSDTSKMYRSMCKRIEPLQQKLFDEWLKVEKGSSK